AISSFYALAQLRDVETLWAVKSESEDFAVEQPAESIAETATVEAISAFDELASINESETESAEPAETAVADSVAETVAEEAKAEAVIAEKPVDTFDIDASVEEEFRKIMSGHSSDAVIEEENKQIADDDMSDDLSDEVLAQSGGVDSSDNELVGTLPDGAVSAEPEKPRTMDFFDLPDEALKPEPPVLEKAPDENVAEVEDLFGSLLIDEPEEKNKLSDPSEVFNMFDTDESQDDFDKYQDEKIEEESEKKKTTDTRKYIAQDIADNIASFSQLLEPLNAIKENKIRGKSGILFDWEMRIQALIGDLPIKTYWRNNFRNYEI
ncbi:MAG: hypothetical protein KIG32_09205, partial [Ruminiclostridium sp.]|nr:hypothetical protein [Ruminiclostridium sp.]